MRRIDQWRQKLHLGLGRGEYTLVEDTNNKGGRKNETKTTPYTRKWEMQKFGDAMLSR